jgi:hypothetical protein
MPQDIPFIKLKIVVFCSNLFFFLLFVIFQILTTRYIHQYLKLMFDIRTIKWLGYRKKKNIKKIVTSRLLSFGITQHHYDGFFLYFVKYAFVFKQNLCIDLLSISFFFLLHIHYENSC